MRTGNSPPGGNGTRVVHGRIITIRGVVAMTVAVVLMALAGCGGGSHLDPEPDAADQATPDRWTDRHGTACESLEPGRARCRAPDGRIWYREDVPTPGNLVGDPVKAMMWMFSHGCGDAASGSGPNAGDRPAPFCRWLVTRGAAAAPGRQSTTEHNLDRHRFRPSGLYTFSYRSRRSPRTEARP